MSELVPSLIGLDKGLNLQTAKLVAPAGSVLDTLNYEQVDFQGQKRIDGFARFDGGPIPAVDEYYFIELTDNYEGSVNGFIADADGNQFGVVVSIADGGVYVVLTNKNFLPSSGDSILAVTGGIATPNVTLSVAAGTDSAVSVEDHYNKLLEFTDVLRSRVEELPGNIIGLHWFRDRLYAVADVTTVSLEGTTPIIYPNDVLTLEGNSAEVKVLDSYVRDNTRLLFLSAMNPADWAVEGLEVSRDSVVVGTIAGGFEPVAVNEEIASFFEADYGWHFVDQGWLVNFENGLSLFGSLPSINQNITDLGVQGPTNVAGTNGAPLILTQNVVLTDDGVSYVNGWKNSQTPTSYALETDNLLETDGDSIYADAYISWNGTTGEVVSTQDGIYQYPASATVTIELP